MPHRPVQTQRCHLWCRTFPYNCPHPPLGINQIKCFDAEHSSSTFHAVRKVLLDLVLMRNDVYHWKWISIMHSNVQRSTWVTAVLNQMSIKSWEKMIRSFIFKFHIQNSVHSVYPETCIHWWRKKSQLSIYLKPSALWINVTSQLERHPFDFAIKITRNCCLQWCMKSCCCRQWGCSSFHLGNKALCSHFKRNFSECL